MNNGTTIWARLEKICVVLSWVTMRWPVIVVAFSLLSPVSPHLRLTGDYASAPCAYGGVHGLVWETYERACPLIGLIDMRGRGQW